MKATIISAAMAAFCLVACGEEPAKTSAASPTPVEKTPVATNQGDDLKTSGDDKNDSKLRSDVKHIDNFGDIGPSDKPEDNMVQRPAGGSGPIPAPEPVKAPEITPQRRSVDEMMKVFGQMVTASSFCSTPFLNDGRKVEETLDNVQAKFDEIAGSGMVMKLVAFDSHDAATLADSENALLKKMAENTRFAKVLEHAKAAGGHFGLLSFAPDNEAEEIKPEHLVLAFDKSGRMIGMAD